MKFHVAIIEAAGKWVLSRFYHHEHVLALHGAWYVQHEPLSYDHQETMNRLHREIAAAIRRQDPAAAADATRRHSEYWADLVLELDPR